MNIGIKGARNFYLSDILGQTISIDNTTIYFNIDSKGLKIIIVSVVSC